MKRVLRIIGYVVSNLLLWFLTLLTMVNRNGLRDAGQLFLLIFGIVILLLGAVTVLDGIGTHDEHGSVGTTVVTIIVGVLLVAFGKNLTEIDWVSQIVPYAGLAAMLIIALLQFNKFRFDRPLDGKFVNRCKYMTLAYPVLIIARIVYLLFDLIMEGKLPAILNVITLALFLMGLALWLGSVFLIVKDSRRFRSEKPSAAAGSGTVKRGSVAQVQRAMQSVAQYYNGGYSQYGSGRIYYDVSVDFSEEGKECSVAFIVRCSLTGDGSSLLSAKNVVQERLNLILSAAQRKIKEIDNSRNYKITVRVAD